MTDSFSKLIKQHQGALPDISESNYEMEHSMIKSVNDAQDAITKDFADRNRKVMEMSERLAKYQKEGKPLQELAGLIGTAATAYSEMKRKQLEAEEVQSYFKQREDLLDKKRALAPEKFEKAKEWALLHDRSIEDAIDVLYKDADKDDGGIKEVWTSDEEVSEGNNLAYDATLNKHYRQLLANAGGYTIEEQAQLTLPSIAEEGITSAGEAKTYLIDNIPLMINSVLGVKKQFPGMEEPLSYLDATGPQASAEDALWAGALLKDAVADVMAGNAEIIDQVGRKFFNKEIFPKIYDQIQYMHKRTVSKQLENAAKRNYSDAAAEIANRIQTANRGIDALTESVSIYEILGNGKDNVVGWSKTVDLIEHALEKGMLHYEDLEGIIDEPFKARDNSETNLQKLKPGIYTRLEGLLRKYDTENSINQTKEAKDDILARQNEVWAAATIGKSGRRVVDPEVAEQALKELRSQYGWLFGEGDKVWDQFNNWIYTPVRDAENARERLDEAWENQGERALIHQEWVDQLPEGPEKDSWQAKIDSGWGYNLTKEELEQIGDWSNRLMRIKVGLETYDKVLGMKEGEAIDRARAFYQRRYEEFMLEDLKTDTPQTRQQAKNHAKSELEKAIHSLKKENENQELYGQVEVKKFHPAQIQNNTQYLQWISNRPVQEVVESPFYITKDEETAILEGIKNDIVPGFFWDRSRFLGNTSPTQLFLDRVKATEKLREDSYEGKKYQVAIPDINNGKSTVTDVGQHIVQPENLESMLDEFEKPEADENSVFRASEKNVSQISKEISSMTLREILQLRLTDDWNEEIGLGIYDLKTSALVELLKEPGLLDYIDPDDVFNKETQRKLIHARILQKANKYGSTKTFDNTYRRLKWLTKEEQEEFKKILIKIAGKEGFRDDPYNSLNVMSTEVAKAALEDAMSYGYA